MDAEPFDMRRLFVSAPDQQGEDAARKDLRDAQRRADAYAAEILAASECPPDLREWGRIHGIPTFAEFTWEAGFRTGMRVAMLKGRTP